MYKLHIRNISYPFDDVELTTETNLIPHNPDWGSSSQNQIVFQDNDSEGKLFTIDVTTRAKQLLYNNTAYEPDWSPDGSQLVIVLPAVTTGDLPADNLIIINSSGGVVRTLVSSAMAERDPDWSTGVMPVIGTPTIAVTPSATPTPTATPTMLDDFNRANNPSIGSNWGGDVIGFNINNNQLFAGTTPSAPILHWKQHVFGYQQEVSITLVNRPTNSSAGYLCLVLKGGLTGDVVISGVSPCFNFATNKVEIFSKRVTETYWTLHFTSTINISLNANDRIRATMDDKGKLDIYINGTRMLSYTLDTWTGGGSIGVAHNSAAGIRLDNFDGKGDPKVLDNFNRANATSIGPSWGFQTTGFNISNHQMVTTGSGGFITHWRDTAFGAYQHVSVVVASRPTNSASGYLCLLLKAEVVNDAVVSGVSPCYSFATSKVEIWSKLNSSSNWIQQTTSTTALALNAGNIFQAQTDLFGALYVYVNGSLSISYSMSSSNSSGHVGLAHNTAAGMRLDDFDGGNYDPSICISPANAGPLQFRCQPLPPTPDPICRVRLIDWNTWNNYKTNFPAQVNEVEDMQVVYSGGIRLLEAPTINAEQIAGQTMGWDINGIIAYAQPSGQPVLRVQFPQSTFTSGDTQIWYRVYNGTTTGWLLARYNSLNYATLSGPCGNLDQPSTLSFPYDRRSAANYAIEHSYDTAYNHGNLQSVGLVTQRITTSPQIPYAYFRYSDIGQAGKTGSAVFVSQSLWMGGLPMIWGQRDNPNTPNFNEDSCIVDPAGQPSLGWRYCFDGATATPPNGNASNPFDTHEDLKSYWVSNSYNNVLRNNPNNTVGNNSIGRFVATIVGQDSNTSPLAEFFVQQQGTLGRLGTGVVGNPSGLSQFVVQQIGQNNIQRGDYLYINSNPTHGLVIIGWGSAISCRDAIFASGVVPSTTPYTPPSTATPRGVYVDRNVNQFADTYQTAPSLGITNPVPWVVDFTSPPDRSNDPQGQNVTQETQSPVPRPFYCTLYRESVYQDTQDYFSAHDWQFYALPNQVEVSTSTGVLHQLYVDPDWQW